MTPQQLRNSILQQAIEGKLVEQRPEEGIAEELYAQIQVEKKELIAEGKIKKEKPLPEITEDEIPFDIPESWKWVRLNNICHSIGDIDHKMPPSVEKGIPYVSPSDFTENGIDYANAKQISEESYEILSKKFKPALNDIIFPRYGTIGKIRVIDTSEKVLVSYSCCTIKSLNKLVSYKFISYVLLSPLIQHDEINRYINKTTQPNVGLQSIKNFLFPLPPLEEQKRIVAKIEELLPFVDKYEKAYNALEEYNARFPEDMRKSILQQAIEGKLVEQRPEEGTAEELYSQIQVEKKKLIAEGKIKKEKILPEITEDEIPFDIPESWKWTRIGELFNVRSARRIHQSDWQNTGIPFFRGRELVRLVDLGDARPEVFISEELYNSLRKFGIPQKDDVLISAVGTLGKTYVIKGDEIFYYKDAYILCIENFGINPYYLKYCIESSFIQHQIYADSMATTVSQLTIEKTKSLTIPLPPLAEQKRIVAKIEELLPYCEKLK